jgi:predicted Zn-dependent peptidase
MLATLALLASPSSAAELDVPFQTFTLPNGLTVVVHEDHKAPIVAVNVWYRVGSKDEQAGRTGFAHLFEHLMFQGSENHRDEFFVPFDAAGATDQNGTTNTDRTNYFENVPTTALDMALWMESDRMGHLLGAIDQAVLDEQRGVVQNEKRQGENQPYGQVRYALTQRYPAGHPYSWTTIGSMRDLDAATLDDVKAWFTSWYGPNNAVLAVVGDVDVATARAKVERYFGDIPASPDLPRPAPNPAPLKAPLRVELTDRVPQVRLMRVWNVAEGANPDTDALDLAATVLGGLKTSRLDERLLFREQVVDRVSVSANGGLIGSAFVITADVKEGIDPAKVEAMIDEEVKRFVAEGPTPAELARAQVATEAAFARGIERIGGFGGKADVLAQCATFTGDPGCFRKSLATVRAATPATVQDAAARWLGDAHFTLVVNKGERPAPADEPPAPPPPPLTAGTPDPKYQTTPTGVDRTQGVPPVASFPALTFPALERATLKNGLRVVLARRPGLPIVQARLEFGGGYASDPADRQGLASLAADLLDEGAADRDALAFGRAAEDLGLNLEAAAGNDFVAVTFDALKDKVSPSLGLLADAVREPTFADLDRVRQTTLAALEQAKANPVAVGRNATMRAVLGPDHPYASPFGGKGTAASLAAIDPAALEAWRVRWLRPDNATLFVVGDLSLAEVTALAQEHLGAWKGKKKLPTPAPVPAAAAPKPRVILVDKPGAVQANLFAGRPSTPSTDPAVLEVDLASQVLCGEFTARLNMNLREDKHWSYGAYCNASAAVGPRAWIAAAPVQSDKALESLVEMRREIGDYATAKAPATAEELGKMVDNNVRGQPGSYETAASVLTQIASMQRLGRPDDWPVRLAERWHAIGPQDVQARAAALKPEELVWVVVGDRSKLEEGVRALGWGDVEIWDAEGRPVGP